MEGGRIVQSGTPQEIVRNPANDYVADFVAHMNPLGVLRAEDVMRPLHGAAPEGPRIDAGARLREAIELRAETGETAVVERDGAPVGLIGETELLSALAGRNGPPA